MQVVAVQANGVPINSSYVFGERNSGTNYVESLICRNCISRASTSLYSAANQTSLGWKHGFPTMLGAPDDVLVIAVYREPIAWLHSLHRTPWHTARHLQGLPFAQFIRSAWMSIIDDEGFGIAPDHPLWGSELMADRNPLTGDRFANPMRLRTAKHRAFAGLDQRFGNVLRVTYETVLADPEGFLNALCVSYNLQRKPLFDPIKHDRATPGRGVFEAKPVPELAEADLQFIRSELDLGAERLLGYELPMCAELGSPHKQACANAA